MTVELIQGLLLAFAIVVILMPPYIRLLRATGFTKQIRIEGPAATRSSRARRRWAAP
jgi:UDP-N-acetylmuramyl pentapeptide phosphotransferase/UDP-N-acetylglucosamine-1-phosphate transferase